MAEAGESLLEYNDKYRRFLVDKRLKVRKKDSDHVGSLITTPVTKVGVIGDDEAVYRPVKRSTDTLQTYYPVGDGSMLDAGALGFSQTDATTRSVDIQPAVGTMYEIHSIRLIMSATAAGRTGSLNWYDGAQTVPIWDSGGANMATGADFLIYPVDVSTYMTAAIDLIGSPPLKVINTQYIRMTNTDLAAAETMTMRYRYDTKAIGGLG